MFREDLGIWLNHFEYHAEHPRSVPQGLADELQPGERQRIARSIATFQLGEHAAGESLLEAARCFARAREIPSLVRITELFIREEQRHAALLRHFMEDHGIALKTSDWTDAVFRRVRALGGLELYLYVLITAELIGIVYYRTLESATGCQRLKVLCRTLVCDELAHIGFESHVLLGLRAERAAAVRTLMRLAHRVFLAGAASVVWLTHRPVLRHAGHNARTFVRLCLGQYAFYLEPAHVTLAARSVS
jgi:hypothetical protein